MEPEKTLIDILKGFQSRNIRYLLIGGHALAQYGSPLLTKDYDFWLASEDKEKALSFLTGDEGFEGPLPHEWSKPILTLFSSWQKIDLFFARKMTNREGEVLDFGECRRRATLFEDSAEGLEVWVPCVKDLIALKKMRDLTSKDVEDLKFLESLVEEER